MTLRNAFRLFCLAGILTFVTGCPVPQPPGMGKQAIITEPRTKAQYYLYLPEAYVKNNGRHPTRPDKGWPLVMTFHGMKPYDTWDRQAHEWEQEADNYGYIVCAPWLQSCDSFMEYPLRHEHSYVLADRERVMAIMDQVFATTRADPKAVLSTSWSCGGYMAHYFANRYPSRFTCIATRLSNFAPELLLESNVPLYKNVPMIAFIGDGDFPACKSESEQAVAWYKARGFKASGKTIDNMGHRRIPQCAAAFFAEQLGIEPLKPERAAATLAQVRMKEYEPPPALLASMSPRSPKGPSLPTGTTVGQTQMASSSPMQVKSAPPIPSKTPPSGAGAVKVADTSKRPSPTSPTPPQQQPAKPLFAQKPAPPPVQQVAMNTPPKPNPVPNSSSNNSTRPPTPPRSQTPVILDLPPASPRTSPETSKTRQANTSGYSGEQLTGEPIRPTPTTPRRPQQNATTNSQTRTASTASPPSPSPRPKNPAPTVTPTQSTAQRSTRGQAKLARSVPIKLITPSTGTAPLYTSFSVDLPNTLVKDAEFLWMDNGIWICDEPRGNKILDQPGKHRLSVLVVAKDGQEYRGSTDVIVLAKGPDARGTARTGTN